MKVDNQIEFCVHGPFALFTDPATKIGGEKYSYPIPTYEALLGILKSVYWKPSIDWEIDCVRVMNVIQTASKGIRPIRYYEAKNDLAIYTYLADVCYQVRAHLIWNEARPDLWQDHWLEKHMKIMNRSLKKGGRRDVFLGTRECQAYVEPCEYGSGEGYYDGMDMSMGVMYHGITYPRQKGENLKIRLWKPELKNGEILFCKPEECPIVKEIGSGDYKIFQLSKNLLPVEKEGEES